LHLLCGLCAFARDIPIFGCGLAAVGLCGEYFSQETRNNQKGKTL
jgi:hypothetical protein